VYSYGEACNGGGNGQGIDSAQECVDCVCACISDNDFCDGAGCNWG